MSIGERLSQALTLRSMSNREFIRSMTARGVPGSSEPAVYRYLRGEAEPSLGFIQAAAEQLGVRSAWLALGDGEPTQEQEKAARYAEFSSLPDITDHDVEDALSGLPTEDRDRYRSEVRAIARFSQKIQDAGASQAPWVEREARRALLQAALRFLIGADELFLTVTLQHPDSEPDGLSERLGHDDIFLRASSSPGWRVSWEDAVLDLFSRRVRGLGERTDEYWDQHVPAAGGPPPIDYRM